MKFSEICLHKEDLEKIIFNLVMSLRISLEEGCAASLRTLESLGRGSTFGERGKRSGRFRVGRGSGPPLDQNLAGCVSTRGTFRYSTFQNLSEFRVRLYHRRLLQLDSQSQRFLILQYLNLISELCPSIFEKCAPSLAKFCAIR